MVIAHLMGYTVVVWQRQENLLGGVVLRWNVGVSFIFFFVCHLKRRLSHYVVHVINLFVGDVVNGHGILGLFFVILYSSSFNLKRIAKAVINQLFKNGREKV